MSSRAWKRPRFLSPVRAAGSGNGPGPERVKKTTSIKPLEREKPYPRVEVMKRHPNAPIAVVRPRHVEDPEGRWDVQHFRRYLYRYTDVSREMEDKLIRALIEVVPNPKVLLRRNGESYIERYVAYSAMAFTAESW